METFTVGLHSASSVESYPQNGIACFTKLSHDQTNLDGKWEVALTGNCFHSKFLNMTKSQFGNSVCKGRKVNESEKEEIFPWLQPNKRVYCLFLFAKVLDGSHLHNYRKQESQFSDFLGDTISQRIFIKTMRGLT